MSPTGCPEGEQRSASLSACVVSTRVDDSGSDSLI